MSEIVTHQPQQSHEVSIQDDMNYASAVANSDILPQAYRNKPANALIAIGLGQAMGLSRAESLYRIDVIQGKPTASAELIAANVRKAGHKLRVRGDDKSCTATIIRADDPDYEYTVTRDTEWARGMGLLSKDNYKKQPGTMLQWRAITAVARLACSEALYGVAYTPDEMTDLSGSRQPQQAPRQGGYGIAANMPAKGPRPDDVVEVTHEEQPAEEAPVLVDEDRKAANERLVAAFDAAGIPKEQRGREAREFALGEWDKSIASPADLTVGELGELAGYFEAMTTPAPAEVAS